MISNARSCSAWRLYVILDRAAAGSRDLAALAAAAIRGGADVLQLRDKSASAAALLAEARRLVPLARKARVPLIINDRPDVALAAYADGVHLGQDDLPVAEARRILGADRLIGKSTHSLEQAVAADQEAVDYLGFGPLFATPTKPGYGSLGLEPLLEVTSRVRHPLVCIGGIDADRLETVLQGGAQRVAVVRAVCGAADPEAATRALKERLTARTASRPAV